ncbi:MAG: helix-hairpin-helix domain-containing protein [Bacteroidales bacterium]
MKQWFAFFIIWLAGCNHLHAQYAFSPDKWTEYVEEMAMETGNEEQASALYAELSFLAEHPLDLNRAGREQLKRLPFLSDAQIEGILAYRKRYGEMNTVYELKNIEALDFPTIELLLPFVYTGESKKDTRPLTVENLLKYGKNELQIRYDQCFQKKKGYAFLPDSVLEKYPNRRYLGEPFYHSLRYSYTFGDKLQAGAAAEKDAGEPFWNAYHKGYDYTSFHLFVKDAGSLKSLALGDYKVSFGQGLVVSQEFTPGRNVMITEAEKRTNGFRRHFSTNEYDYLRGGAATVGLGNWDISAFYSYRRLDATMKDSLTASTVQTTGLHRLQRERDKKAVLPMRAYGGNIRYATPNASFGLTAIACSFAGYRVMPDTAPYNLFYFRGGSQFNAGVDYLLKNRFLKFYGEAALAGRPRAPAVLNALQLTPDSWISVLLLHRYYDRKYRAWFGNAFSQNTSPSNEQGVYMGMEITPLACWKASAYADFFRFPWLKYGTDAPSSGREYMAQIDYAQPESVSFYVRYRYRQRENNRLLPESPPVAGILPDRQQRLRLRVRYAFSEMLFKTSADGILYDDGTGARSKGFTFAQSAGWKPLRFPFGADIFAACFKTDNYSVRLDSYEKNLPYAFQMPQFYGEGVRLSAIVHWDIRQCLSLSAKLACTRYWDRDTIGSDLETIEGNRKTDIYTFIKWMF